MKKLVYITFIMGITISCSRLQLDNKISSGIERAPASPRCLDILKPFIHATSKTNSSEKMWSDLNEKVIGEFDKQLQVKGSWGDKYLYDSALSHVKILKNVFQIKAGEKLNHTIGLIISTYNKNMDDLVSKKIINKEDVLKPAFVFKTADEKFIWKTFGEKVPENARLWGGVLTTEIYNKMIKEGFFPMGSEEHTPTLISAFEHDLAHLTGFMENPEFMKAIKKLADFDSSNQTDYQKQRAYYFNEGAITISSANDKQLFKTLRLSDEMKHNPSKVSYEEMLTYLKSIRHEELEKTRLAILKSEDFYTVSGGAGREPMSRIRHPFHDIVQTKKRTLSQAKEDANGVFRPVVVIEQLAAFQVMMLKFREVKATDWLYAINHTVKKDSSVYNLFIDKKLWADDNQSGPYELRRIFLNDEPGSMDTEI